MMKANMKGLSGVKLLLLLHGEKMAIAVVGLLAVWFIYGALKLPRLEAQYQAPRLQDQVRETAATVDQAEWPGPNDTEQEYVRSFGNLQARDEEIQVDPQTYELSYWLSRPVISPTVLRVDPELINALGVQAIGGAGLFAFRDPERERAVQLAQEAERHKREEEQRRQQEREQPEADRRGGRERDRRAGPAAADYAYDPAHPNRRPVEAMGQTAGIALQGSERIERAYWATVVAKVPIREQMNRYEDAFRHAKGGYDPSRDFPRYVGYQVQRAEIVPGQPLQWSVVPLYDAQQRSIRARRPIDRLAVREDSLIKLQEAAAEWWADHHEEPVAAHFLGDPVLALPLPPLVGRNWGANATHPDIPLAIHAAPIEEDFEERLEEADEEPEDGEPRLDFRTQQEFAGGPRRGVTGLGHGLGVRPPGGTMREFGAPPRHPGAMRRPPGATMREFAGAGGQRAMLPHGVDYWLLRFFDYTVEPGKKYRYRVRLVLADPNFGLPDETLDPAVIDRHRREAQAARASGAARPNYRLIDQWSEPSPPVSIPLAGAVHVAEASTQSSRFNDEPSVTLWAQLFDIDHSGTAIHVAKEKELRRGYVVNLREKMDYTGDGDRWIDTFDSYQLHTGMTVLDVAGAQPLPGRDLVAPARVLLMDPAGELTVRDELADSSTVEYLSELFAEPDRRGGRDDQRGPPMREFGGPPGRGPH